MARLLMLESDATALAIDWGQRLLSVASSLMLVTTTPHAHPRDTNNNCIRAVFYINIDQIMPDRMMRESWRVVREALTIWRALTCCRGFGEDENPAFWGRVGSALSLPVKAFDLGIKFPADASNKWSPVRCIFALRIRNFDAAPFEQEHVLPLQEEFANFVAVFKSPASVSESNDFKRSWCRLEPFLDRARVLELDAISWKMEFKGFIFSPCAGFLQALPSFVEKITQEPVSVSTNFAQLKLEELSFKGWQVTSTTELDRLTVILGNLPVHVSKLATCVKVDGEYDVFSQFVRCALGIQQIAASSPIFVDPPLAVLKSLNLTKDTMDTRQIIALFTALPYTQALESLKLSSYDIDEPWIFSDFELMWIGYAIFHPRTKASSFRKLTWTDCWGKNGEPIDVFMQMILDPLQLLSTPKLAQLVYAGEQQEQLQSSPTETIPFVFNKFQLARVKQGARIRASRDKQDSTTWITLQHEMSLEMCETSEAGSAFYCVLVPGYGFGWVRKAGVLEVNEWVIELPLTSALTSFKLGSINPATTMSLLLNAVGKQLTELDVALEELHATALDEIVHACPVLKDLRLVAFMSYGIFAPMALQRCFFRSSSQLSSLTIDWRPQHVDALLEILRVQVPGHHAIVKLKKLHLCKLQDVEELYARIPAIDSMLRVNKHLEQLILSFTSDSLSVAAARSAHEARLLAYNGEDLTPFEPKRQRLAFLSVIYYHARTNGVCRQLDATLAAMILEFGLPRVMRRVDILH